MKKVAIPLEKGNLNPHFGHCKSFKFFYIENGKVVKEEELVPPPHEPGVIPKWMSDLSVNVIISGGMGPKAVSFFEKYGIEVIIGVSPKPVSDIVQDYINDRLDVGNNLCDH